MSDNPFLEPEDAERTVIRPVPGGQRQAQRPAQQQPQQSRSGTAGEPAAAAVVFGDGAEAVDTGVNPLVAAAAPLLQLLARLPNTISHPDPGELRERAV